MPVPKRFAPCFPTMPLSVETAFCMVSSNPAGVLEGLVCFDFHNVQLHFFAKRELRQLDEVEDFAAVALDDFVADGHGF